MTVPEPQVGPEGGSGVSNPQNNPRVFNENEGRGQLSRAQVERLMTAIDPDHVESKRGMSYIAQHQARAEMTRIFGVGNWDSKVVEMRQLYEYDQLGSNEDGSNTNNKDKKYYITCWIAGVLVRIRDYWGRPVAEFLEYHVEANSPLPSRGEAHAMAVSSVESYALRRALIGLGDRLGLGLYDGGKVLPLVKNTLQLTDPESPLYRSPEAKPAQPAGPPPGAAHQQAFQTTQGEPQ